MTPLDDERAILGAILRKASLYKDICFPEAADPISALDFQALAHRRLFSLIRTHFLPDGDLKNLVYGCEAQKLREALSQEGFDEVLEDGWGWFEFEGGEEWLFELISEGAGDISESLGRFLERRPISQRQAHELVV